MAHDGEEDFGLDQFEAAFADLRAVLVRPAAPEVAADHLARMQATSRGTVAATAAVALAVPHAGRPTASGRCPARSRPRSRRWPSGCSASVVSAWPAPCPARSRTSSPPSPIRSASTCPAPTTPPPPTSGKGTGTGDGTEPGQGSGATLAPGQTGSTPGQSGETPANGSEPPGQSGSTPGQSGDNPSVTAPGQSGDSPSATAPGQVDNPSATAPGQSGSAPGQSGSAGANGNGNAGGERQRRRRARAPLPAAADRRRSPSTASDLVTQRDEDILLRSPYPFRPPADGAFVGEPDSSHAEWRRREIGRTSTTLASANGVARTVTTGRRWSSSPW